VGGIKIPGRVDPQNFGIFFGIFQFLKILGPIARTPSVCFFPNLSRRLLVRSAFRSLRKIRFLSKCTGQLPPKCAKNFGEFSFKNRQLIRGMVQNVQFVYIGGGSGYLTYATLGRPPAPL